MPCRPPRRPLCLLQPTPRFSPACCPAPSAPHDQPPPKQSTARTATWTSASPALRTCLLPASPLPPSLCPAPQTDDSCVDEHTNHPWSAPPLTCTHPLPRALRPATTAQIDDSYVDEYLSVSQFPLSAAYALGRITNALEQRWGIV